MAGGAMKRAVPATVLSVAMLALAGCGGSSPSHPAGSTGNISADVAVTRGGPHAGAASRRQHARHHSKTHAHRSHQSAASSKRGLVIHTKRPAPVGPASIGSASAGSPVVSGRALQQATQAAGTGGAHGKSVAKAPRSSPFIRAADAVCRSYRQQVRPLGQASTLAAQEQEYPTLVADARAAVAKLRTISAPKADASAYKIFVDDTSAAIDAYVAAQARSTSTVQSVGNAVQEQDLKSYTTAIDDATTAGNAAHALGFKVCGSPGAEWL